MLVSNHLRQLAPPTTMPSFWKHVYDFIQDDVLTLIPHFPRFRSTTIKWLNKYIPLRKWQSQKRNGRIE